MSEALIQNKKKSSKLFSILQRVGRAFMLPIALLPIAGLLLGIGSSFTNVATLEAYHLIGFMGPGTLLYSIFSVLASVGSVIFDNLPILFAMGVALGMAEHEKATALIETVHECQERLGYFFNHWECGFRYTRPLSSFATLLAVSGFSYDCEKGILTLAPCLKETEYRFPVITAEGMGCFEKKDDSVTLSVTEGNITLQTLRLAKETRVQGITLSGTPLSFAPKKEKDHLAIKFASPITLKVGASLEIQ